MRLQKSLILISDTCIGSSRDMIMIMIIYIAILGLLGLIFGSFAGAQVWRLRARQLLEDKEAGEAYDKTEYKQLHPLLEAKGRDDRSRCLHCGHQLRVKDLIPLISWVGTRGKCRYCKTPIGRFEPLIESSVALFFVGSYVFWPIELLDAATIAQFIVWLISGVLLAVLFAYDAKWFLLPDRIVYALIAISIVFYSLGLPIESEDVLSALSSLTGALAILSGLYLALWKISDGRWIGFGDVKLGIALAFFVGTWELAFLTLFLANLIGCLIVLPGLAAKKISRTTQVPFGPMLIAAAVISVLFGNTIIAWYLSVTSTTLML